MRRQIYEKKRIDNAFKIIEQSFVYGAKLKRNPISDEERLIVAKLRKQEELRFEIYKRAWFYKNRKSKSIGGNPPDGKRPFVLDWHEMIAARAEKARQLELVRLRARGRLSCVVDFAGINSSHFSQKELNDSDSLSHSEGTRCIAHLKPGERL